MTSMILLLLFSGGLSPDSIAGGGVGSGGGGGDADATPAVVLLS